jgi:hypothetical protein
MTLHATAQAPGAFGICAAIAVGTLYVTKSTAQSAKDDQPEAASEASRIYGVTIPSGYRDWRLISIKRLTGEGGKLKQIGQRSKKVRRVRWLGICRLYEGQTWQ